VGRYHVPFAMFVLLSASPAFGQYVINAGLADPKMKSRIADLGPVVFPTSTAEFAKLIAAGTEKWVKVIREANIKL
jgi:hypothetical protein